MSFEKKKVIKATSPKGSIQWFKLLKPDQKFNKYSVDLIVEDSPEIRKIIEVMDNAIEAKLKEEMASAEPKRKKLLQKSLSRPIEEQLDSQGKETGKFIMKFRAAASGKKKDNSVYHVAPPAVFNSQAKPYSPAEKQSLQVFNGSIGQINFEISSYALATGMVGATLKPKAAMLIKIQQGNEDASEFGFSASELSSDDESEFQAQEAGEAGDESGDF